MSWFSWLAIVTAVVALVGLLGSRLSRWAGDRGWVYNKHNPRGRGTGTLPIFDEIFQPSIRHVIEEESSQRVAAVVDESGESPDPGVAP